MPRDLTACVIVSDVYQATRRYGEAFARTYGMDFVSESKSSYLSLSRYKTFYLAADPNGLVGAYLTHNCKNRVYGLVASCDGKLLVKQLAAVRKRDISLLLVPSKEDAESISMATPHVRYAPPREDHAKYAVAVYGMHTQDPNWLRVVTQLGKMKGMFCVLAPIEDEMLETLGSFPVSFAVIPSQRQEEVLLQADVLLVGDSNAGDQIVAKARSYGKKVVLTSEWASSPDPSQFVQKQEDVSSDAVASIRTTSAASDWTAPNHLQIGGMQKRMNKLLIKFPTRGRKDKFLRVFAEYARNLSGRNRVTFMVTLDEDDETMNAEEIRKELLRFEQTDCEVHTDGKMERYAGPDRVNIIVTAGKSDGKISAINRDMDSAPEFDVLLLASDDMEPVQWGYDDVILQAMERHFPTTDGVLWFNDGYVGKRLNTLVCMGRQYFQRFGYIYHPDYKSLWCDNEFMLVANQLGRQAYIDWTIIKHEHPANSSQAKTDALYDENDKWYGHDQGTFERRTPVRKSEFGQRVLLSVLVPTLVKRRTMRTALVNKLMDQLKALHAEDLVEFVIDEDKGEKSIGDKRTELTRRAKGDYVVFLDDDDDVSDNYVESLINSLADGTVDCATFGGLMVDKQSAGKLFVHSLRYKGYSEDDNAYYRPPNHINAVRSSIAVKFPFPSKDFSEDFDYAMAMQKANALQSERFVPYPIYLYRPMPDGASGVSGGATVNSGSSPSGSPARLVNFKTGPVKKDAPVSTRRSAPRTRRTRRV